MQVKKFNITKPKKYVDKQGVEKTYWAPIGTMTEFHKDDGSINRIMEIPAIGLEGNIFPFQDKKEGQGYNNDKRHPEDVIKEQNEIRGQGDEVKVEDIPF